MQVLVKWDRNNACPSKQQGDCAGKQPLGLTTDTFSNSTHDKTAKFAATCHSMTMTRAKIDTFNTVAFANTNISFR